jgi:hypothetical protein
MGFDSEALKGVVFRLLRSDSPSESESSGAGAGHSVLPVAEWSGVTRPLSSIDDIDDCISIITIIDVSIINYRCIDN